MQLFHVFNLKLKAFKAISLENVRHVMGRQSRPGCHRGMGENFKTSSAFRSLLILSPGGDW